MGIRKTLNSHGPLGEEEGMGERAENVGRREGNDIY